MAGYRIWGLSGQRWASLNPVPALLRLPRMLIKSAILCWKFLLIIYKNRDIFIELYVTCITLVRLRSTTDDDTFAVSGGRPVQSYSPDVSFAAAMEEFSLASIMARMAQDLEDKEGVDEVYKDTKENENYVSVCFHDRR